MCSHRLLLAVLAATSISALPLNINLGAYSPALVVGDGEISFGGSPERASEVLQTLSAGAQNGAVPSGQTPPAPARQPGAEIAPRPPLPQQGGEGALPAAPAGEASLPATQPSTGTPVAAEGFTSPLVQAADAGSDPVAVAALPAFPDGQVPNEFISHAVSSPRYPNMMFKEKRSVVISDAEAAAAAAIEAKKQRRNTKVKRDIDGFRAALQYARDASLTAPRVELGFGIVQNAGVNVPANSAANGVLANGQPRPVEKRDVAPEPENEADDEKLGMTLIAISEI